MHRGQLNRGRSCRSVTHLNENVGEAPEEGERTCLLIFCRRSVTGAATSLVAFDWAHRGLFREF
eukprot:5992593-Pleurochrysis_carterae.AAC.1